MELCLEREPLRDPVDPGGWGALLLVVGDFSGRVGLAWGGYDFRITPGDGVSSDRVLFVVPVVELFCLKK